MKKIILIILTIGFCHIKSTAQTPIHSLTDGTYQVIRLVPNDSTLQNPLLAGQIIIPFDTLFNPGEYKKVIIDTLAFVPMALETGPDLEMQSNHKKLLSVTFTPQAAEKMKAFTAKRVMKQVVIVLGGKAITMHKIREAITGNKMQITRCNDKACEYLNVLLKNNVKKK